MNLPNKLTLSRILIIPLILLFMLPWGVPFSQSWDHFILNYGLFPALLLFIAASLTDYFDGHIARSQNIVSNFGKFLDPIADKLLVLSVFIALVERGRISALIPIIVLFRELVVSGVRMLAAQRNIVIAASQLGKFKTVSQIVAIILILIQMALAVCTVPSWLILGLFWLGNLCLYFSVIMTLISGVDYLIKNKKTIR